MISENYEGKVIAGKVITSVGMIPDLNVIHVNFADDTFERYGSVEALDKVVEDDEPVQMSDEEKVEIERAAEMEAKRQAEEDAEIQRQAEEREANKLAEEEEEDEEVETAEYLLLEKIPYTDEEGNVTGEAEAGSVQTVPVVLGDSWVEQKLAEKVVNENK